MHLLFITGWKLDRWWGQGGTFNAG